MHWQVQILLQLLFLPCFIVQTCSKMSNKGFLRTGSHGLVWLENAVSGLDGSHFVCRGKALNVLKERGHDEFPYCLHLRTLVKPRPWFVTRLLSCRLQQRETKINSLQWHYFSVGIWLYSLAMSAPFGSTASLSFVLKFSVSVNFLNILWMLQMTTRTSPDAGFLCPFRGRSQFSLHHLKCQKQIVHVKTHWLLCFVGQSG